MSALGQKQTYALQKAMSALPPIATAIAFFGVSALGQKRTSARYSITLSAIDSMLSETLSPSDLAVLRLITSSNLVAL